MEYPDLWEEGPVHKRVFNVLMQVGPLRAVGRGRTKKEARARAADAILKPLKQLPLPAEVKQNPACPVNGQKKRPPQAISFKPGVLPCGRLSEVVQARGLKYPEYDLVDSHRSPEGWLFTMRVTVEEDTTVATGTTKKAAKNNAATKMLEILGVNCPEDKPLSPSSEASEQEEEAKVDEEAVKKPVVDDNFQLFGCEEAPPEIHINICSGLEEPAKNGPVTTRYYYHNPGALF